MVIAVVPDEPSDEMKDVAIQCDDEGDGELAMMRFQDILSARDRGPEEALFGVLRAAAKVTGIQRDLDEFDGDRRGHLEALCVAKEELAEALDRARAYPALREVMEGEDVG